MNKQLQQTQDVPAQAQQILEQLVKAVETDQIKLPSLPEVALKIRQTVEKNQHSASDIAELIAQDSALTARLLQLANSPLYRTRSEIENLQSAVTRLGIRIVKDLVVMLAIKQAFQPANKQLEQQFRQIWQSSIDVAAAARTLAKDQPTLDPEMAVLAGLIHNIGALPVIEMADRDPQLASDPLLFKQLLHYIQAPLGEKILQFWNFPAPLVDVARLWNDFSRRHEGEADYVDLIQAALLHTEHGAEEDAQDWSQIEAIKQLGLDPDCHQFNEDMQQLLHITRDSLMAL